jgi:hypothetical protein
MIGYIKKHPNPPGIDMDCWRRIVREDPRLERPETRPIINPFTGKPTTHIPPDTDANVIVNGQSLGAISVGISDDRSLDVWAPEDRLYEMEKIAREVAGRLGGRYVSFEESSGG